jgi:X-Pro dipeptidyl-peptidase (S15 family)
MRRLLSFASLVAALLVAGAEPVARQARYRTLDDTFEPPKHASLAAWKARAAYLREHILATAGLLPMPEKTPLNAAVFGDVRRSDYTVSKVYFESFPGFLVTGNLYRPAGDGPFPAILSPHGHWTYGRLENTPTASVPGRAINLARQGFVVFTYDMIGYNDSRQIPHTFGGPRENLWGLSLAGLQLLNSIRAIDFLETLPYVKRDAIGATGASGGGTQTFLLAAVDDRVKVAAPVNMISLHMQGGCLCENLPGLRLDVTNVEIAATIAPRPLLMVSATGDWTAKTIEREYPATRGIFALFGAEERVHATRVDAPHNYNKESREAMYAWMARWLQGEPAGVRREERGFTPDPLAEVLVFYQRPLPDGAISAAQLTADWIAAAKRQLTAAPSESLRRAFRHALGFDFSSQPTQAAADRSKAVLLAGNDPDLVKTLQAARFAVRVIGFTPFDADAASKIRHFETYNRTAASQRVADIAAELQKNPGAILVAGADAGLEALLAAAAAPVRLAVVDAGAFDTSSDAQFVERLYIPGLRRAGDLQTAAAIAGDRLVVHNGGAAFGIKAPRVREARLTTTEIVSLIRELK